MFELRSFQRGDAEAVWALHNEALEHAGAHRGHGPWGDDLRDTKASYLDLGGAFVVMLVDGELVGMGGLQPVSVERVRAQADAGTAIFPTPQAGARTACRA